MILDTAAVRIGIIGFDGQIELEALRLPTASPTLWGGSARVHPLPSAHVDTLPANRH